MLSCVHDKFLQNCLPNETTINKALGCADLKLWNSLCQPGMEQFSEILGWRKLLNKNINTSTCITLVQTVQYKQFGFVSVE